MSDTDIVLPPPQIDHFVSSSDVWTQNRDYFVSHRNELLGKYRGQHVAVHNGQIVAVGENIIDVATAAYAACGYVPVYVDLITDEPPRIVRVPSARLRSNDM